MNIEIEGTITIEDYQPEHDKTSKFCIDSDGQWNQWGATEKRLCETVGILDNITTVLNLA